MKRKISTVLVLLLLLTSVMAYAEPGTDAVSAVSTASPAAQERTIVVPAKPVPVVETSKTEGDQVHVVVPGDMLWKIAKKYNLSLEEIIALNPQLKNPNILFTGQKITVGKGASITPVSAPEGSVKVYKGLGHSVIFRNGPGKDSDDVPVYSFNVAMASALFDAEGRIIDVYIDCYEVATPNYDGESMPHFSGWPDKEGYNVTDHETQKVTGVSVNTKESVAAEVNGWLTKRERGDSYHMNPQNEWYKQMDFFQEFFVGKTVAELEEWFAKNTTSAGRPIKATTDKQEDLDKLAKLTEKEKAELADVVSGATMSIRDAHGDYLGAVANAYANRVEVVIPVK